MQTSSVIGRAGSVATAAHGWSSILFHTRSELRLGARVPFGPSMPNYRRYNFWKVLKFDRAKGLTKNKPTTIATGRDMNYPDIPLIVLKKM